MLQWGRDLKIAEIYWVPGSIPNQRKLQWGRDLKIAEIPSPGSVLAPPAPASMGRDLKIAEIRQENEIQEQKKDASMGPRSEDRGNGFVHVGARCKHQRFNGAAI